MFIDCNYRVIWYFIIYLTIIDCNLFNLNFNHILNHKFKHYQISFLLMGYYSKRYYLFNYSNYEYIRWVTLKIFQINTINIYIMQITLFFNMLYLIFQSIYHQHQILYLNYHYSIFYFKYQIYRSMIYHVTIYHQTIKNLNY